jgi:hypothetical protein
MEGMSPSDDDQDLSKLETTTYYYYRIVSGEVRKETILAIIEKIISDKNLSQEQIEKAGQIIFLLDNNISELLNYDSVVMHNEEETAEDLKTREIKSKQVDFVAKIAIVSEIISHEASSLITRMRLQMFLQIWARYKDDDELNMDQEVSEAMFKMVLDFGSQKYTFFDEGVAKHELIARHSDFPHIKILEFFTATDHNLRYQDLINIFDKDSLENPLLNQKLSALQEIVIDKMKPIQILKAIVDKSITFDTIGIAMLSFMEKTSPNERRKKMNQIRGALSSWFDQILIKIDNSTETSSSDSINEALDMIKELKKDFYMNSILVGLLSNNKYIKIKS